MFGALCAGHSFLGSHSPPLHGLRTFAAEAATAAALHLSPLGANLLPGSILPERYTLCKDEGGDGREHFDYRARKSNTGLSISGSPVSQNFLPPFGYRAKPSLKHPG